MGRVKLGNIYNCSVKKVLEEETGWGVWPTIWPQMGYLSWKAKPTHVHGTCVQNIYILLNTTCIFQCVKDERRNQIWCLRAGMSTLSVYSRLFLGYPQFWRPFKGNAIKSFLNNHIPKLSFVPLQLFFSFCPYTWLVSLPSNIWGRVEQCKKYQVQKTITRAAQWILVFSRLLQYVHDFNFLHTKFQGLLTSPSHFLCANFRVGGAISFTLVVMEGQKCFGLLLLGTFLRYSFPLG